MGTDADKAFGNGDTLTFQFDRPTNVSRALHGVNQPPEVTDGWSELGGPLGADNSGQWLDASTCRPGAPNPSTAAAAACLLACSRRAPPPHGRYRIEVVNAWLPQPQINGTHTTRAWLNRNSGLRAADGVTDAKVKAFYQAMSLSGSTGHYNAPRLLSVEGYDPDNGDDVYSAGDVLRLQFDIATYEGEQPVGQRLSTAAVDRMLRSEFYLESQSTTRVPSLGKEYAGESRTDRLLSTS